jgi:hypothetical protein
MRNRLKLAVIAKPFFKTFVVSLYGIRLVSDAKSFAYACSKRRILPVMSSWEEADQRDEESSVLPESILLNILKYTHCVTNNCFWDEFDDEGFVVRLRELLPVARGIVARCDRLLERVNAKGVLIFQGYMMEDAILRALAIQRGLEVITMERTLRNDRLLWDSISGITVNKNEGALWFWRYENTISQECANEYAASYLNQIKSLKQQEHSSPDRSFTWPTGRARILFLGQVYTDSSLLYGLYGCQNPVDVMASILKSLEANNATAVFKLHPKEHNGDNPVTYQRYDDLTYRKLQDRIPNLIKENRYRLVIDYTNRYDTYNLINECDVVVTVNSQAGLEAALASKPVVHGRSCFYGGCGFTYEFSRVSDIEARIAEAIRSGPPDEDRARRFFYIFYEMFCIHSNESAISDHISSKLKSC